MTSRRASNGISAPVVPASPVTADDRIVLNGDSFQRMLALERKRSERSRKPFLLMLVDLGERLPWRAMARHQITLFRRCRCRRASRTLSAGTKMILLLESYSPRSSSKTAARLWAR